MSGVVWLLSFHSFVSVVPPLVNIVFQQLYLFCNSQDKEKSLLILMYFISNFNQTHSLFLCKLKYISSVKIINVHVVVFMQCIKLFMQCIKLFMQCIKLQISFLEL